MEWNKKFNYPSSTRALVQGKRHYSLDGSNLPSVTTILSATKSEEDKAALAAWKERVGKVEAERIKKESSTRGSNLHKFIEEFLHGKLNKDLIDVICGFLGVKKEQPESWYLMSPRSEEYITWIR